MSRDSRVIRENVRTYIVSLNARGDELADGDSIVDNGFIASIQLLDLINYVAETYAVEIDESHIFDGQFASVDSIVAFIANQVPSG